MASVWPFHERNSALIRKRFQCLFCVQLFILTKYRVNIISNTRFLSLKIFIQLLEYYKIAYPFLNFFKFLKKSNFFMTMRSWTLVMVPLFSVSDPLSVKLTIFKI